MSEEKSWVPIYTEMLLATSIVKKMAEKMGAKILKHKRFSNHDDDYYLHIVLAEWRGEYVTWMANTKDKGFHEGHYFHQDYDSKALEKATKNYNERGFYQQPQTETMPSY